MVATEKLLHLGSAKAPYYTKLGPEHYLGLSLNKDDDEISLGHFDGEGAKVLGLFGEPIRENDHRFAALFQGLHPETYDPMRKGLTERTYDGKPRKAVIANDIVVSAPSAVTAMFAAGNHKTRTRSLACLEAAAKDTRAHIEKNYCFTRTGAGGSVRTPAKPIWGCFTHIEDRAGMPQLHVHNVLFTSAVRQDGKYGALDLGPLLKRETIFEIGQLFRDSLRGHLAREFQSSYLQFPNVPIKNGRSFTVQGYGGEEIPQGLLDRYSPRSKTIREALRHVPSPRPEEVQAAVLRTRPEKPPVETAALRQQEWQTIAKEEFKFDTDSFLGRSRDQYIKEATDQAVFAVLRDRVKERQQLQQPQPSSTFPSPWQAEASKQAAAINRRASALAKNRRRSASVPSSGKASSAPKRDIWALTRSLVRRHSRSSNPQGKNRPQYSFEGALSDARAKSQKRAQRLRTKLRFLYYTSQIDRSTYRKYTRPPKKQTRLAIETKYWTGFLLVQEYVNAPSLSAQIHNRVFTQAEVRAITTSLLLILQYVHEKGHLCHGDVQPGNVLVDLSSGISVYLIDFGLARSSGNSVVVSMALGGTPGFTAPDQVLNRRAEAHGDIYGVAVIAMCLLTGKDPSDIASLRDSRTFRYSYRESLKGAAPPPEYFLKWIDKCVSPNSANRYQSARVAHEALKASEQRYQKARTVRWWLAPPLGLLLGTVIIGGFWRYQTRTIDKHMMELAELEAQSMAQLIAAEEQAEERRQEELRRQEEERKRREEEAAQAILDQRQRNVEQLLQTRSCSGCDLREVDLSRVNLEGVDLRDADLSRAKLEAVRLVGANLAGAVLTEANLSDSNISNANFSGAYMERAQLQRVNGSEAVFQGAVLTHTNFGSGILPGSTFVSADLSNADLGNAEFEGANFEMANLDETFTFFTSFRDARMPNGFER